MTDRRMYRVTLRADGGTFPRIIVSATSEDDAIVQACQIELAPRRSVLSVEEYDGE
jgi:hypothetical protein